MLNKKIISDMFDNELNIDAIHEKIMSKIERKNNRKIIYKYSFVSISLICLISAVIMLGYFKGQKNKVPIIDGNQNTLHINKIDDNKSYMLDADVQLFQEDSQLYFDFLDKIKIPNDLTLTSRYKLYTKNNNIDDKEEYQKAPYDILHDYIYYYEGNDRKIILTFSEEYIPLRDYFFEEEGKDSIINGSVFKIYQCNEVYRVCFTYEGINFDIETSYITQDELVELLTSFD